ncbi:MAG: hypothetical protein JWM62_1551 [Frankiales bacterium]|jgi:hypothetical protein|nr:hypothetical protein [Frankiales bacterium]
MSIFKRNQPGEASQPEDTQGDGPVTLSDRTEPGGQGSPDTNQAKTEPMDPTGTHSEPLEVPDLDSMNVGGADPQAPRHPDALRSGLSATGAYAHEAPGQEPTRLSADGTTPDATRGTVDTTTSTGRAPGPEQPVQTTTGEAHRAPGIDGQTPEGESVTTDTSAGAARMGPSALDSTPGESPGQGDDASVPSSGTAANEGTSQEHQVVAGIKLPQED